MEVESAPVADMPMKVVPKTLLKKRKRDELWAINRMQHLESSKSRNSENRKLIFKSAEQFIKEYRGQMCCDAHSRSGGNRVLCIRVAKGLRVSQFGLMGGSWMWSRSLI